MRPLVRDFVFLFVASLNSQFSKQTAWHESKVMAGNGEAQQGPGRLNEEEGELEPSQLGTKKQ